MEGGGVAAVVDRQVADRQDAAVDPGREERLQVAAAAGVELLGLQAKLAPEGRQPPEPVVVGRGGA